MEGTLGADGGLGKGGQFAQGGNLLAGMGRPDKYKILFIEKLPRNLPKELLEDIFWNFRGLVDIRPIPEKGYAFIEFENDDQAADAL